MSGVGKRLSLFRLIERISRDKIIAVKKISLGEKKLDDDVFSLEGFICFKR